MTACQGRGGPGQKLTYAQLQGLWIAHGGPAPVAPAAAAIALAESGGCTTAQNPSDNNGTQTSWGLWQISNGTHSMPAAGIYNPDVNAAQAVAKYRGAGNTFKPWGTYNTGAYKAYLSGTTTPDMSAAAGAAATTAAAGPGSDCAASWPSATVPVIPGIFSQTVAGGGCIIRKATIRHFAAANLMLAGGLVVLPGLLVLVAFAFRSSGAARLASQLPGPAGTVSKVVATGRVPRRKKAAGKTAAGKTARVSPQRRAEDAQARQAAGSTAQQKRAVAGQAPRKRPPAAPAAQPRAPRAEHHE